MWIRVILLLVFVTGFLIVFLSLAIFLSRETARRAFWHDNPEKRARFRLIALMKKYKLTPVMKPHEIDRVFLNASREATSEMSRFGVIEDKVEFWQNYTKRDK